MSLKFGREVRHGSGRGSEAAAAVGSLGRGQKRMRGDASHENFLSPPLASHPMFSQLSVRTIAASSSHS